MRQRDTVKRGRDGLPGQMGPIPKHEWDGTKVRFQKDSGDFGDWIDLSGKAGPQGPAGGPQGPKGDQGIQGVKGERGETGAKGDKGDKGDSGRQGDKGERGIQGLSGDPGDKGDKGDDGLSAYEVWLSQGNSGTEDDFFNFIADKVREKVKDLIQPSGAGPLKITLEMLRDVVTTGVQNNDVLKYNSTTKKWVAGSGGGGSTQNVFIQETQPVAAGAFLWINTTDGNLQFLVEDGV